MISNGKTFFFSIFCIILNFCGPSHAIYDPRGTHAVKPTTQYELGLPWYLSNGKSDPPVNPQFSGWDQSVDSTPRNPVIVNDGARKYRPQYETVDGIIEQESITNFHNNYGQNTNENFDFQQTNDFDQSNGNTDQNYDENGWFTDTVDSEKPYEDFAIEIEKPYKDTKDLTEKPVERIKIAKYDSTSGAQCPTSHATGQFVYPPDCKFFVNCWNGRAFVQPCAPGTLFNPETLECDFPMKVKCYEKELGGLIDSRKVSSPVKKQSWSSGSQREEWSVTSSDNNPSCPPWVVGLLPHPNDCTKFLQCANGATYIMDCGPGTAFNPAINNCDWPYNVRGCGNAPKPEIETTTVPYWEKIDIRGDFRETPKFPSQSNIVKCPDGQDGLFPHPHDCKKFLQCSHGNTFIMDCGPGTVFNPVISNCDWPYNVRGCADAPKPEIETTTVPYWEKIDIRGDFRETPNFPFQSNIVKCPDGQEGLFPHPNDCKKFLQCSHGNTFIMDCGPGTVFNPVISNCDWPYNVRGCGDALNPKPETTTTSMRDQIDLRSGSRGRPKLPAQSDVVTCPDGQEGLLPHPRDCKKFLQCSNGNTYIMDCGPGTVFNPLVSVCDFPYNVKNCDEGGQNSYDQNQRDYEDSSNQNNNNNNNHRKNGNNYPNTNWNEYNHNYGQTSESSYHITSNRGESGNDDSEESHTSVTQNTLIPNREIYPPTEKPDQNIYVDSNYKLPNEDAGNTNEYENHAKEFPTVNPLWLNGQGSTDNNYEQPDQDGNLNGYKNPGREFPTVNPLWINGHATDGNYERPDQDGNLNGYRNPRKEFPTVNPLWINGQATDGNYERPDQDGNFNGREFPTINPLWINGRVSTTTENVRNNPSWGRGETNVDEPGRFKPSSWRGQNLNGERPLNSTVERPWLKGEPPFPVSYMPPVQPVNYVPETVQTTPISGQVLRLRDGSVLGEGYLEVQGAQPGWGIVCDIRNQWTLKEANVVCRQLGYTRGAEMAWQGKNVRGEALYWIAADSVQCFGNETYFQSCKFTHDSQCDVAKDAVGIRCLPNRVAYCKNDEIPHHGFCYHLADSDTALNHAEALGYCNNKGSKLLDIIDQNENNFISEWLVRNYPNVDSVMTSGFGFTTWNRTLWLWEDSQRAKFRFNKWWPGWISDKQTPPSVGARPACVVMKRKFPCHDRPDEICTSDYFFWDIEDCAASSKGHSYVCKRAYNDIGCVYGKGQYYSGNANITASGTPCLSWGDQSVQQYLNFKVSSAEIREKLKEHNYCRNPNPNKEIKPWCYTGSNGEYDYCDIPPCAKQGSKKSVAAGQCKPKHFECTPGECIPSPWICDGEKDCTNGADEQACFQHLDIYTKIQKHRLGGYDVEKWLNTPLKTCALRCKEADFTCRSFSHKADGNVCLLSDSNVGLTGALQPSEDHDYYEMNERSINCSNMFVCNNKKCINQSLVCNGKNNCGDRSDETICDLQNLGYEIRLSGSNNTGEGRVEVKAWEHWGQVCDDGFGMIAASIACKELGFEFGAREVRSAGFYSKGETTSFLMDQIKCRGNETSLRECDFDGWGVHNCLPDEAVGIVCKIAVNTCQDGFWKCDNSPDCIPTPFVCDEVVDCGDRSDESPEHCEAPFELRLSGGNTPLEGRVEVRHHGIWGTVCDDDFSKSAATVICRSLGYGGSATAIKNGAFGPGEGPIWLDEVSCQGNETQLYKCDHEPWGRSNCRHDEDVGVRCEYGEVIVDELPEDLVPDLPEIEINDILPTDCGMRFEDFDENDEYMAKVVQGSVAPKGAYPWQASLRVRGHSRSSHWCGAVVISPLYVLTAAHCLEGYNKGMYFVRAGDFNTEIDDGTEVEANIEDYYIHEDFRKGQRMNNDIALVMLKGRGIPLGRNIMPICLPPENIEYLPGLNCTISGWGSIESGKSVQSNFLRFGWVPILDQSICRADYVYGEGAISDGMVCAGHLNEGVDSCDGDSGGPLACYHNNAFTLYGLTSWGKHCGAANKPGVYVRIGHYRRWIDNKIRESLSGR